MVKELPQQGFSVAYTCYCGGCPLDGSGDFSEYRCPGRDKFKASLESPHLIGFS